MFEQMYNSLLVRSWHTPIYIEDDIVWIAQAPAKSMTAKKFGAVTDLLRAELQQKTSNIAQTDAMEYARHFHDTEFVMRTLIPYLDCFRRQNNRLVPPNTHLVAMLDDLAIQARNLLTRPELRQMYSMMHQIRSRLFPQRCLIIADTLFPLHVLPPGIANYDVMINGIRYQYCNYGIRPVREFMDEHNKGLMHQPNQLVNDTQKIHEFSIRVEQLIRKYFNPVDNGIYKVLFKDDIHELQYNRANFILLRGPLTIWQPPNPQQRRAANRGYPYGDHRAVPAKNQAQRVYMALHVKGKTRSERLAAPVGMLQSSQGFWNSNGLPCVKKVCMGHNNQYRKFLSTDYTEPEAVVQYLHAAVIGKTGACLYHQWLRNLKRVQPQLNRGLGRR